VQQLWLLLIGDYTNVGGVHQTMGSIMLNELKLEIFFETCVDKILRASITPLA